MARMSLYCPNWERLKMKPGSRHKDKRSGPERSLTLHLPNPTPRAESQCAEKGKDPLLSQTAVGEKNRCFRSKFELENGLSH